MTSSVNQHRAYTVGEIDALRHAHENKYLFGRYGGPGHNGGHSRPYMPNEKEFAVEERVRTSMLAGHTVKDLVGSEQ